MRWKKALRDWTAAHADLAAARDASQHGYLPQKLEAKLPVFDPSKPLATRTACGAVMCALAAEVFSWSRLIVRPRFALFPPAAGPP